MTENQFTIQKKDFSVSQNSNNEQRNFVITKKIAKHGKQSIIVIPNILSKRINAGMLVKVTIDVLEENREIE